MLAGVGAFLVLLFVETAIIAAFDPDLESLGSTLALQGALAVTLVAVALFVARPDSGGLATAALGLRRPTRPGVLKSSAIAYFGYIGAALAIAVLLQPEQEDVTRDLGYGESALGSIAAGALIVGAAPLTEEIFFRGFMFGGLRRGASFAVAAGVSSVVWGIFHFTGSDSWGVVLQLSVFGIALAWLYERTGSIWPPIAIHALNNALAFAILTS